MARKPGRPADSVLTRERILNVALALVDSQGVEALSMRKLAAELGVDPMAIYNHLPNKQAVLQGLVERVFQEMPITPEGLSWQEQIHHFAHAYYNLARAHPDLILTIVTNIGMATAAVFEANETLYRALEAAGLAPATIMRAADLLIDYLNGFAMVAREERQPGEKPGLSELLDQHPASRFPTLRRVLNSLSDDERVSDINPALDIFIAGVERGTSDNRA